jgi:hypothetical protein
LPFLKKTAHTNPVQNGLTIYCGNENFIPYGKNFLDLRSNWVVHPGHSPSTEDKYICQDDDIAVPLVRPDYGIGDCVGIECDPQWSFAMIVLCDTLFFDKVKQKGTPETILQAKKSWEKGLLKKDFEDDFDTVWSVVLLHELFHVVDPIDSKIEYFFRFAG